MQNKIHNEKECWYFENESQFDFVRTYMFENYAIGIHTHEFCEINIVTSGRGEHCMGNNRIKVNAGDVFVIPSGVAHMYNSEENLSVSHIVVKSDFFTRYQEELSAIKGYMLMFDIEPYIRQLAEDPQFLRLDYNELKKVEKEFLKIAESEKVNDYILSNALTLCFICTICKMFVEKIGQIVVKPDHEIMRIMEFVQNNLDEKLTVKKLCVFAGMSQSTLNRQFKKILKITPMEYVVNCRTDRAKTLIEEKRYSKSTIAQMCGFYDCSHMYKYLKKGQ